MPATAIRTDLHIADLPRSAYDEAAALMARAMRDNALHVAAFDREPRRRQMIHTRFLAAFLRAPGVEAVGAYRDGDLLGAAAVAVRGSFRSSVSYALEHVPLIGVVGPRTTARVAESFATFEADDPEGLFANVGPVAVRAGERGNGIGSALMAEVGDRLDTGGALAQLETADAATLRFFERFGYEAACRGSSFGVPVWLMRRDPA